ncbi:hypothetical protein COW36_06410, partial [bacterium (Candidatus Blackallbacteria) CG17_big_fil_post_rev_8_21_14_2_50_48_46]
PRIPRFMGYYRHEVAGTMLTCLVQGYMPGQTLKAWVEAGKRFQEAEIVKIAEDLLELLIYLHSFSPPVIHRDIKPENLILSPEGEASLVDFGAVNDHLRNQSRGSTIVGTFGYMPPEQLDGQAVPGSDLFALGASLIYALTGLEPGLIEKENLSLNFRPYVTVSEGLAAWLELMTQPDWKQRFQTAQDALEALRNRAYFRPGPSQVERVWWKNPVVPVLGLGLLTGLTWAGLRLMQTAPQVSENRVMGRVSYAGSAQIPALAPRFWIRDEATGQRLKPAVDYQAGKFEIQGLPAGKYGLNLSYDTNPDNPIQYPGDYRSWTVFEIKPGQPAPQLQMNLVRLIHLTSPQDNNRPLKGWENACGIDLNPGAQLAFAWESLGPGVRYDYQIQELNCASPADTPLRVLASGSTEKLSFSSALPPTPSGHVYRFSLEAWQAGHKIGRMRTHGSQDHDWDLNFKIP